MLEKGIEVEPGESRIRHKHITFIIVIDLYWVYGHLWHIQIVTAISCTSGETEAM